MKIIQVTEHSLTTGTGKKTVIPLDQRPGIFFRVVCGTYETPFFTKEQTTIPVTMVRGENAQSNVRITCDGENLTVEQGYMQASFFYLFRCANNDWVDTCELRQVSVDSLNITKAELTNGTTVNVTAAIVGTQVRLTTSGYTPTDSSLAAQIVITSDNQRYIHPIMFSSHQTSTNPVRYDYASTNIPRVINSYQKERS